MTFKLKGERKARAITFRPPDKNVPNRVNRCPRDIWDALMKKKGSPRQDQDKVRSPLEEYLETGLLWTMSPKQALAVHEGKMKAISPMGPNGGAYRPSPREPQPVPGLEHAQDLNSATIENATLEVPDA